MKTRNLFFSLLISQMYIAGFAQSLSVRQADKQYANLHYADATELYEQVVERGEASNAIYQKLADCYYKIKDTKNAEKYYARIADIQDEEMLYQYAQSLMQNGKYQDAKTLLQGKSLQKNKSRNILRTDFDQLLNTSMAKSVYFMDFNSIYADFSPVPYKNGVVFASARKKGGIHKNVFGWNNTPFLNLLYIDTAGIGKEIHRKKIEQDQYQKVTEKDQVYSYDKQLHTDETKKTSNDVNTLGYYGVYVRQSDMIRSDHSIETFGSKLNTRYHEGPVAFHPGNTMAVFTRNNFHKGRYRKSKEGTNKLKLFSSSKSNEGWTAEQPLPFNSDEYSSGHAAFDPSGTVMFFTSDRAGGQGGTDLYKVSYMNGSWGSPENLGNEVNTDGNEMFPYMTKNGVLIFSSDGHGGLGGLDIFATNLKGQVKNLGYPVNSNKDDFGVSMDEKAISGFLSSNRNRNGLDDDIYSFELNKPISFLQALKLIVLDRITGKPIPEVSIMPNEGLGQAVTNQDGVVTYEVEPGKTYGFVGKKLNYVDGHETIDVKEGTAESTLTLYLDYASSLFLLVSDRLSGSPLYDVKVKIVNRKTNTTFLEQPTPSNGQLRKELEGVKVNDPLDYTILLEKDGYLSKTVTFNYIIQKPGEIPVHEFLDIKLDKIELGMDVGKVIHINPIYFDLNKSAIRSDASKELDKIVQVMKDNPSMVIELGSHTDCRSSAPYNMALSERRARASAQYVISKGIDKNRIYGKGYGESKLVNTCACESGVKSACSEDEHQLNRRTEFVIVKI
jgi:outer membrane protein OmpA-like peptidoglycan-associated protein/tetratricopeptide (TPR) repeat protein